MIEGGQALSNGIIFESDNKKVVGILNDHKEIQLQEKETKNNKIKTCIRKIPMLRGVYNFITTPIAEAYIILQLIIMKISKYMTMQNNALSESTQIITLLLMGVTMIALTLNLIRKLRALKSVFYYHGAEHKVFNTYSEGKELTVEEVKKASRVSTRCGTNLAVMFIPMIVLLWVLGFDILVATILGYALALELFYVNEGEKKFLLGYFYKVGGFLQKRFFTKEPSDEHILLGIRVAERIIGRDEDEKSDYEVRIIKEFEESDEELILLEDLIRNLE